MAQQRKLAAEMEKVFKKVEEGQVDFAATLAKMDAAVNENQRDKFKDELKREMKKLQRLRDYIKAWQVSPEVKDKEKLALFRRNIEERMEQFKDIEKESKTKPHSRVGLQAAEKMDPKEKEKLETMEFLREAIASLNGQVEVAESELDAAAETKRRRRGQPDPAAHLHARLAQHKQQLHALELTMRLLDNDALEAHQVNHLRQDILYYVEHNGDDDFVHDEHTYDDLNLEELEKDLGSVTNIGTLEEVAEPPEPRSPDSADLSPDPGSANSNISGASKDPLGPAKSRRRRKPRTPNSANPMAREAAAREAAESAESRDESPSGARKARTWSGSRPRRDSPTDLPAQPKSVPNTPVDRREKRLDLSPLLPAPTPLFPPPAKNVWNKEPSVSVPLFVKTSSPSSPQSRSPCSALLSPKPPLPLAAPTPLRLVSPSSQPPAALRPLAEEPDALPRRALIPSLVQMAKSALGPTKEETKEELAAVESGPKAEAADEATERSEESEEEKGWLWLSAAEAASPLGPRAEMLGARRSVETAVTLAQLEAASAHLPLAADQELVRRYVWRNPVPGPAHYPQTAPPGAFGLELHTKLAPDTLFWMFYYLEGSLAQYLAAKALRALCWRFHKKFLVWFQRKEDPLEITDDFERGSYVYFDYENWTQKLKENFKFEYAFLEDKVLPFPTQY